MGESPKENSVELRKHQKQAKAVAQDILVGVIDRRITVAHVTPGGGKTLLASIFAHELVGAGAIDHVVIVCPRDSLRSQVADGFFVPALGLCRKVTIWDPKSGPQRQLFKDHVGIVTTYQATVIHSKKLEKILAASRTLLILDEGHHLAGADEEDLDREDYAQWRLAIEPLVARARHVLLMTGTLRRSDGERIPFVSYDADGKPLADIRYTRQDALDEAAVLPIEFRLWDGNALFEHRHEEHEVLLSKASGEEARRALRTALQDLRFAQGGENEVDGYVMRMLRNGLDDWTMYRQQVYRGRAIVVCNTQEMARWAAARIEEMGHHAILAISDESDSGKRIRKFRKDSTSGGEVLVTVGMAYEGLDVPDATHLILITNRRARPWLEQAVARVTRVNSKSGVSVGEQFAYVYLPDDKLARDFIDDMMSEQDDSVPLKERQEAAGIRRGKSTFVPKHCDPTHRREASDRDGRLTEAQSKAIADLRLALPECAHLTARELAERSVMLKSLFAAAGSA